MANEENKPDTEKPDTEKAETERTDAGEPSAPAAAAPSARRGGFEPEPEEEPTSAAADAGITRGTVGLIASVIGLLSALFGGGVWGILYFFPDQVTLLGESTAWSFQWIPLIAGIALIVFSVVLCFEDLIEVLTVRRTLIAANVTVMAVLAIAIVVGVNYLGNKYQYESDWTLNRFYTLSDQTEKVLASLEDDVNVYVFITPYHRHFEKTQEMLERYEAASEHLKLEFINRDMDRKRVDNLVKQFGIATRTDFDLVVFEHAPSGRSKEVLANSLGEGFGQTEVFKGEELFTAAILSVLDERKREIYFTTGHDELRLDDFQPGGLSDLQKELAKQNVEVKSLRLAEPDMEKIPETASALVIVRPTQPFKEAELQVLREYLDRPEQGRLIVLYDVILRQADPSQRRLEHYTTGLEELIAEYGVERKKQLIIKETVRLIPPGVLAKIWFYDLPIIGFPQHEITEPFAAGDVRVDLFEVSPLAKAPARDSELEVHEIVRTGGKAEVALADVNAWEPGTDPPEGAAQGPFAVAMAVSRKKTEDRADLAKGPRMVVFGDADFITNPGQRSPSIVDGKNYELFLNSVNWVTDRQELITIEAKRSITTAFTASPPIKLLFMMLSCAGLPALCLGSAFVVYFMRKR